MSTIQISIVAEAFGLPDVLFKWDETDSMDQYNSLNVDSVDDLPDTINVYHPNTDLADSPMELSKDSITSFRRVALVEEE